MQEAGRDAVTTGLQGALAWDRKRGSLLPPLLELQAYVKTLRTKKGVQRFIFGDGAPARKGRVTGPQAVVSMGKSMVQAFFLNSPPLPDPRLLF